MNIETEMIVFCTICSDTINPSENIFVTKCGHLFHYDCLRTWIYQSKSCPQCRHRVSEKCMFRIFPTTMDNTHSGDENAANLQTKLNHTLLTLNQHGIELKSCHENFTKIQMLLETSENAVKTLEENFFHKGFAFASQRLQLLALKNQVQDELYVHKNHVQDLQGALYASESENKELYCRLLATRQQLAEEKKISAEWHSKFLQLEENLSAVIKQHEGMKNEIEKVLCVENSRSMNRFNTSFFSKSAKGKCNSSVNTMINKNNKNNNLNKNNIDGAALQHPSTSKGEALVKPLKQPSLQISAKHSLQSASDENLSTLNYKHSRIGYLSVYRKLPQFKDWDKWNRGRNKFINQ